jgi:hypothetical protein
MFKNQHNSQFRLSGAHQYVSLSLDRCKASDDNNDEAGSRSGNERASSSVPDSLPVAAPDADWRDFRYC